MNAPVRLLRMPPCLGRYERGDIECDGHPSVGATLDELLPCLFRDRCVAFRKLLQETGKRRQNFVTVRELTRGPIQGRFAFPLEPDFDVQLDERILRYDIRGGIVTSRRGSLPARPSKQRQGLRRGPPTAAHRRKLARRGRRRFRELRKRLHREGLGYLGIVAEHIGRPFKREEVGARPGELFVVDSYEERKCAVLYYRLCNATHKLVQRPVVRFRPRIAAGAHGSIELQVACPHDAFISLTPKRDRARFNFEARERKDSYKVRLRQVNRESAVALAQVVKKLVAEGYFGFDT